VVEPRGRGQATDRAHRIGQEAVTVYRLIARQTIEHAVLAMHNQKSSSPHLDGTGTTASLGRTSFAVALAVGRLRGFADDAGWTARRMP
jgi:hypothetical protein